MTRANKTRLEAFQTRYGKEGLQILKILQDTDPCSWCLERPQSIPYIAIAESFVSQIYCNAASLQTAQGAMLTNLVKECLRRSFTVAAIAQNLKAWEEGLSKSAEQLTKPAIHLAFSVRGA